jgi:hypothetical protein
MKARLMVGAVACALWAGGALAQEDAGRESAGDMRGLTVTLGGGLEGYTGGLAPQVDPGVAYGVTAAIKPSKVLGLELGYSGAVNGIDDAGFAGALGADDPDVVRNGGHAAVTVGLTASPLQPYVLGGIGLSDYNVRGGGEVFGLTDDTVGNVPVGAGVRVHIGDLTADLRGTYNFLFDQELSALAPGGEDPDFAGGGRYNAMLNIGATF